MIVKSHITLGYSTDIIKTRLNTHSIVISQNKTVVIQVSFLK